MNIFFCPNIQAKKGILDETESHHCIKVLRLTLGDQVYLVDGTGGFYEGIIKVASHRTCEIEIRKVQNEFGKRDYKVHIAIAPTKNIERFEWFLEKAAEIGIDQITPLLCQRSERKILREDRLGKVITTAMKQSLKAYLPELNPLTPFHEFIKLNFPGNKLIAYCMDGNRHDLISIHPESYDFTLLIGPEGDFSDKEVQTAIDSGFLPVSLGSSRLRTETAGVAACQIIADIVAINKKKIPLK